MKEWWNNLIGSTSIVNSATILSVVLAIIFFVYQEYRQHSQEEKEIVRLKDDLVNLIIRNHVNSGVHISKIDLRSFFEGFELLKGCKLKYGTQELIKILYAKVYENEHISNEIRLDLLKELESLLNEYEIDFISKINVNNNKKASQLSANVSSAIIVLLYPLFIYILANQRLTSWIIQGWRQIIIVLPIFLLIIARQYLDKLIYFFISKILLFHDFISSKNKNDLNEDKFNIQGGKIINDVDKKTENTSIEEVVLDEQFKGMEDVLVIFQQRFILEKLIRELYFRIFHEETNLPVSRMISLLRNEKILEDDLSNKLRKAYSLSSHIIHMAQLPQELTSYKELIDLTIILIKKLNKVIKDQQSKNIN